jgi:uncharacterized membrane protein
MVDEKGSSILSYPNNLVIGITIVASFFSFLYIGHKNIWFDEAYSIYFAKLPWREFWSVLSCMDANQGLYYAFLKFWLVLGDSEFSIRALSALFAVASIPVLYALARRLFGVRAGLIAALLFSVNAFFIEYAQEARSYSLTLFLVILSSYLFVRVIEDPSNKKLFYGYICVSAIAVYSHFFAALVLVAQMFSVPFLPSNNLRTRQLLFADLLITVLIIPIGYFILTKDTGQISWIPKPSVYHLKRFFMDLSGDVGTSGYITGFYLLSCGIAFAHALVALFTNKRSIDTWRYAFIFSWFGIPVAITFAFSFIKPIFINKYLIVSLPGLVLLTGIGISLIKDKYCYSVLYILLIFLSVNAIFKDYYPKEKENFRDSVSYIYSNAQRGDGILIYLHRTMIPFEYYWQRLGPPRNILYCAYPSQFGQYKYLGYHSELTIPYLESLKEQHERIWVFIRKEEKLPGIDKDNNFIISTLSAYYKLKQEKNYFNILVLQFTKT